MKFTIYAPGYNDKSGGAWVLHFLCHSLNKIGYEASLFIYDGNQGVNPSFTTPVGYIQDSVVIYPEVITTNPLQAKKVVRYLLNKEGLLQGRMIKWGQTDYPLAFSKLFRSDCETLFYPNSDLSVFYKDATVKTQNSFYIGKGHLYGNCPKLDCFEITRSFPETKQELANALRRSKILFTYDAVSAIALDAALCGCLPFMLQKPLEGADEGELGKYWAESEGDIEEALQQMCGIYDKVERLQNSFPERLAAQVEKIKHHFSAEIMRSIESPYERMASS